MPSKLNFRNKMKIQLPKLISSGLLLVFFVYSFNVTIVAQVNVPERGFISKIPAVTWEEGLLSGNGTIGANIFGQPINETIVFSHERMFLPMGPPKMPPDQSARLFEIRQLIDRGLYKQAAQLQFDLTGQDGFWYPDPFGPAFDMVIKMNNDQDIFDYVRSVNFETGETLVHWSDKQGTYERRLFVSRADGIAVMQIRGSEKGILNCEFKLRQRTPSNELEYRPVQFYLEGSRNRTETHIADIIVEASDNYLGFSKSFPHAYPGSIQTLEGLAQIETKGGTIKTSNEGIIVKDADEILVFVDIAMIYDPDKSMMDTMKHSLASIEKDYNILADRHTAIHGEMFNRVRLDLGGGRDHSLTTEELHSLSSFDHINTALLEKQFDAGRYNIISSTGELPPLLQGVWAGTYVPDWAGDYTHNGNVQSAIAALLKGNTPELMKAYTSYIEYLVPWMEINAKHFFGARGVVLPSRSTSTGFNNALATNFAGGMWVGGAAWAAHFFYDYYLYTGDIDFLANNALPFMEKTALFFEDYLYEGPDGKYIFSPTQSPENFPGNSNSQASYNATSEVVLAKELLSNLIAASHILDVNEDKIPLWQDMLTKMPEYMIDEHGFVKEWLTPGLENNERHRHASQFYALYHGLMPEEIASNTELQEAFKRSINYRLDTHWKEDARGFMSFGLVQLGLAGASLRDSDIVYECLKHLVNRFWLDNLASMHNHKSLFNMDISGGMPAVIMKMLVGSKPGEIHLLPALPVVWSKGEIKGVLCRGQIEITSLVWDDKQVQVNLVSKKDQTIVIRAFDESMEIELKAGEGKTVIF